MRYLFSLLVLLTLTFPVSAEKPCKNWGRCVTKAAEIIGEHPQNPEELKKAQIHYKQICNKPYLQECYEKDDANKMMATMKETCIKTYYKACELSGELEDKIQCLENDEKTCEMNAIIRKNKYADIELSQETVKACEENNKNQKTNTFFHLCVDKEKRYKNNKSYLEEQCQSDDSSTQKSACRTLAIKELNTDRDMEKAKSLLTKSCNLDNQLSCDMLKTIQFETPDQ